MMYMHEHQQKQKKLEKFELNDINIDMFIREQPRRQVSNNHIIQKDTMGTPRYIKDQLNKKEHRRKESCNQLPPLVKGVTINHFDDIEQENRDEDDMMDVDDDYDASVDEGQDGFDL